MEPFKNNKIQTDTSHDAIPDVFPVSATPSANVTNVGSDNRANALTTDSPVLASMTDQQPSAPAKPVSSATHKLQRRFVALGIVLCIGFGTAFFAVQHSKGEDNTLNSVARQYNAQTISLDNVPGSQTGDLGTLGTVSVNGNLNVQNALVLAPSTQPSQATSGQLYYDAKTHQLSIFNGNDFTELLTNTPTNRISSIGNTTGAITLGTGLTMQGSILQNTGVTGIVAGNNITVTKDSKGNVVVSAIGSSSGTSSNLSIKDNSIGDAQLTYNTGQNLTSASTPNFGGLTINGIAKFNKVGIGTTTPNHALDIVGDINLTGALRTGGIAGTAGQCLQSTGTAIQWGSCGAGISGTGTTNQIGVFDDSGNIQGSDNILFDSTTASLTLGSSSLAGNLVFTDGAGFTGIIQLSSSGLSQDTIYVLPAVSQAIVQICTSAGNCIPNGTSRGDTLYWDGTKWVTTTVNGAGDILYWDGTKWAAAAVSGPGDMMYWNGSKWVSLPLGAYGSTLVACANSLSWIGCNASIITDAVTNIGGDSATASGTITNDGGRTVTERGVVYSTSPSPTVADSKITSGNGIGGFTATMSGLAMSTTYYVRAYATNNAGTAYGNQVSFTTLNIAKPTVTTNAITDNDTTETTANGGGNVTDGGDAPVTELGLVYATSSNPTVADNKVASGSGVGAFTTSLSGLAGNTTYYVRAYAINTGGTAYGTQVSFSTPAVPTVTTATVVNIGGTVTGGGSVTSNGHRTVTERGIVYGTNTNPTFADSKVVSGSGTGSFTANMTGLHHGNTYYVRAYATNSIGTSYGSSESYTVSGYPIGETGPGGGIVFYDKGSASNGWQYLEVAPAGWYSGGSDMLTSWICNSMLIAGADGTAIGTGKQNTADILAGCGSGAAMYAHNYNGGGKTDWFLPSKDELNAIYQNKAIIGDLTADAYWSSSEYSATEAWFQNIGTGAQVSTGKGYNLYVRPIRAF